MKKFAITAVLVFLFNITWPVFASDISIVGTIPVLVKNHSLTSMGYAGELKKQKIIMLQKVKFSPSAQKAFVNRIDKVKQPVHINLIVQKFSEDQLLADSVNLGMNQVPVLDQGIHGSCVTFANAALLDSLIGQEDYVSELCSLTLGNYLAQQTPHYDSGWSGSTGPVVLKQFFNYGIVPMAKQKSVGCGGLSIYPAWEVVENGMTTTPEEYAVISEPISDRYEWHKILSINSAFIPGGYQSEKILLDVKQALNDGNRVTFGTLLDIALGGTNGAIGQYKLNNDTWMITPDLLEDIKNHQVNALHEMLIFGYDDNAVVTDRNGYTNKGILLLRNSWGSSVGDQGDFYMSYEHFKLMVGEVQLVTLKAQ